MKLHDPRLVRADRRGGARDGSEHQPESGTQTQLTHGAAGTRLFQVVIFDENAASSAATPHSSIEPINRPPSIIPPSTIDSGKAYFIIQSTSDITPNITQQSDINWQCAAKRLSLRQYRVQSQRQPERQGEPDLGRRLRHRHDSPGSERIDDGIRELLEFGLDLYGSLHNTGENPNISTLSTFTDGPLAAW